MGVLLEERNQAPFFPVLESDHRGQCGVGGLQEQCAGPGREPVRVQVHTAGAKLMAQSLSGTGGSQNKG